MSKPRLSLDDLYQMTRLREARLLPAGAGAVYVISRLGPGDVDRFDVRTVALDGSSDRQVASGLPMCVGLRPSPGGDAFALMGLVDGIAQACLMDPATGAVSAVTKLSQGIASPPLWSPCGRWLAFTAVGEERAAKGPYDPVRSASVHYKYDGGIGLVQRRAHDLFVVSRDGHELRRLTRGPYLHTQPMWSPAGGELSFMATLDPEGIEFTTSIGIVDLEGRVRWPARGVDDYFFTAPGFSGDGRKVLWGSKPLGTPFGTQARLYAASATGAGTPEVRTEQLLRQRGGHVSRGALLPMGTGTLFQRQPLSPAGKDYAFVIVEVEGRCVVHRIALSGPESCVPVTPSDSSAYLQDADGAHVLYVSTDFNVPPDLYVEDHEGGDRRRLTRLNDESLASRALPEVQDLRFRSRDGTPVHGWLLRPAGTTGPCPTVMDIHGGPHAAWGRAFNLWAHALAGAGYAVILPNPRGSCGYGDVFGTAIQGCWGEPDGEDLMAAVDEAVRLGVADPERLGVGGVSGGGHLTTWLLGHTDRFKAAIPEQMLTNMISFYGESDIGRLLIKGEFGVTPQDGFELLWKYSPLAYAHRVRTPTLLIQCELDVRCPMGEAEQFFRAIRDAGCTAEFMRIPGSFHAGPQYGGITALARPRDEAALDWFERYLRP